MGVLTRTRNKIQEEKVVNTNIKQKSIPSNKKKGNKVMTRINKFKQKLNPEKRIKCRCE